MSIDMTVAAPQVSILRRGFSMPVCRKTASDADKFIGIMRLCRDFHVYGEVFGAKPPSSMRVVGRVQNNPYTNVRVG
jgi:hypothetical protein